MSDNHRIEIALLDVAQAQLRAKYYAKRIEAGVYKTRVVHHGSLTGPLYTEEELLADEVATMARHIQLAEDRLDYVKGLVYRE